MTAQARAPRIFLLSPANAGGLRARMLLSEHADLDLAVRLRRGGAPLGDVFSFISGLYFRGKVAYAEAFGAPPEGVPHAFVITAGYGLVPPDFVITTDHLREIAAVPVDAAESRYREPLERDCRALDGLAGPECAFVLLGSVASSKYLEPLFPVFGERLLFPTDFAGRGDMSRGGLMLRAVRSGEELEYASLGRVTRHGPRPPKLPREAR
jgi:hypothetical protein